MYGWKKHTHVSRTGALLLWCFALGLSPEPSQWLVEGEQSAQTPLTQKQLCVNGKGCLLYRRAPCGHDLKALFSLLRSEKVYIQVIQIVSDLQEISLKERGL